MTTVVISDLVAELEDALDVSTAHALAILDDIAYSEDLDDYLDG